MNEEMIKALEAAVIACANQATNSIVAHEAMQFTQAAGNAAHAIKDLAQMNN